MRSRTRLAAIAAATGLAAGMLGVGLSPNPAGAAPTVLLECDQVNGTATVSKGITNVATGQKINTTSTAIDGGCTGPLATITGAPVATNPLSVKLATPNKAPFGNPLTQGLSCDTTVPGIYPPSGKARITFTNTYNGKPLTSDSYIRLGGLTDEDIQDATGDPSVTTTDYPDATKVSGIVTKGAGLGADVTGVVMYQPTATKAGGPISPPVSQIVSGQLVPGLNSALAGLGCQLGNATLTGIVLSTDGDSLGSFIDPTLPSVDSSLKIQFPFS